MDDGLGFPIKTSDFIDFSCKIDNTTYARSKNISSAVTEPSTASFSSGCPVPDPLIEATQRSLSPNVVRENVHSDCGSNHARPSAKVAKLHPCMVCPYGKYKSFSSSNDLDRHMRTVHLMLKDGDRCWKYPITGCSSSNKTWPPLDNFKDHIIRMHGEQYESFIKRSSHVYTPTNAATVTSEEIHDQYSHYSDDSGVLAQQNIAAEQSDLVAVGDVFSGSLPASDVRFPSNLDLVDNPLLLLTQLGVEGLIENAREI